MKIPAAGLTLVMLFALARPSAAQEAIPQPLHDALRPMLGTVSVEVNPGFADGQLNNCILEFGVMARDWTYRQGGYIRVGGGFGIMSVKGAVGVTLKVILHDMDPRTMSFTPSPPTSAYFVSGSNTTRNAVVSSYPSDVPGAIFVVLKPEPTFEILANGLNENKVSIAFARRKGGSDIVIPIDTSVVDTASNGQRTRSPKAAADFFKCSKSLLEQITK